MGDRVAVLKDGVVQQVGSPVEVYERLANLFVAGFIGSPAMNLLPATVRDSRVRIGDHHIPLDRAALARDTTSVTVGVRPESWRLVADGEPDALVVEATVVEDIGADACIYGTTVVDGRVQQTRGAATARPAPPRVSTSEWPSSPPGCACSTPRPGSVYRPEREHAGFPPSWLSRRTRPESGEERRFQVAGTRPGPRSSDLNESSRPRSARQHAHNAWPSSRNGWTRKVLRRRRL
jgi:hypothetical protein